MQVSAINNVMLNRARMNYGLRNDEPSTQTTPQTAGVRYSFVNLRNDEPSTETPTQTGNAEYLMNGLNQQGVNNLAFGSMSKACKYTLRTIALLPLFAGFCAGLTGCQLLDNNRPSVEIHIGGDSISWEHTESDTTTINVTVINEKSSDEEIVAALLAQNVTLAEVVALLRDNKERLDVIINLISGGNNDIATKLDTIINLMLINNQIGQQNANWGAKNNLILNQIFSQMVAGDEAEAARYGQLVSLVTAIVNIENQKPQWAQSHQTILEAIYQRMLSVDNKLNVIDQNTANYTAAIINAINNGTQVSENILEVVRRIYTDFSGDYDSMLEFLADIYNKPTAGSSEFDVEDLKTFISGLVRMYMNHDDANVQAILDAIEGKDFICTCDHDVLLDKIEIIINHLKSGNEGIITDVTNDINDIFGSSTQNHMPKNETVDSTSKNKGFIKRTTSKVKGFVGKLLGN